MDNEPKQNGKSSIISWLKAQIFLPKQTSGEQPPSPPPGDYVPLPAPPVDIGPGLPPPLSAEAAAAMAKNLKTVAELFSGPVQIVPLATISINELPAEVREKIEAMAQPPTARADCDCIACRVLRGLINGPAKRFDEAIESHRAKWSKR